jgi:hypothetical protein
MAKHARHRRLTSETWAWTGLGLLGTGLILSSLLVWRLAAVTSLLSCGALFIAYRVCRTERDVLRRRLDEESGTRPMLTVVYEVDNATLTNDTDRGIPLQIRNTGREDAVNIRIAKLRLGARTAHFPDVPLIRPDETVSVWPDIRAEEGKSAPSTNLAWACWRYLVEARALERTVTIKRWPLRLEYADPRGSTYETRIAVDIDPAHMSLTSWFEASARMASRFDWTDSI